MKGRRRKGHVALHLPPRRRRDADRLLDDDERGWGGAGRGDRAGVCSVKIGQSEAALATDLRREYPAAEIEADSKPRTEWAKAIAKHLRGGAPSLDLPIDVQATAFQWKVWRALQRIPYGETRAYSEVAKSIGKPKAVRAVARACATNPVALVVPCHRVVPSAGGIGGYRWGADRKERLLEWSGEESLGTLGT